MKIPAIIETLSPEEITDRISASGLRDYGVFTKSLGEEIKQLQNRQKLHPEPAVVTAALNNNDYDHALLGLLKDRPGEVFEGMLIVARCLDAAQAVLQLPEGYEPDAAAVQAAADAGIAIDYGIVDVRKNRHQMVLHIAAALSVSELFAGTFTEGAYISVCRDGVCGPVQKVPYGSTVAELIGETVPMRFFAIGQAVYKPEETDLKITKDLPVGNGVIRFWPEDCCVVQEAEKEVLKQRQESCGKCTFCREGLTQIHSIMHTIPLGKGQREKIDIIREVGEAMTFSTQCSIGMQGSDFVRGTLVKFQKEYEDHIVRRKCSTQKCTAFQKIYVDPVKCKGCMDCMDVCEQDAIEGKSGYIHMIDEYECNLCGKCIAACEEGAIIHTADRLPKLPTRLTKVGRFKKR